jgi:hypothetical protein
LAGRRFFNRKLPPGRGNVARMPDKSPTRWRDVITVHPAAELFPLMSPEDLRELASDIREHGLRDEITITHDGQLVDGRNRLDALELNGANVACSLKRITDFLPSREPGGVIGYRYRCIDEALAYSLAVSSNIRRRHLTTEQKREIIAKLLTAQPETSDRQIAKTVAVDNKTVASVRQDMERREEIPHVAKRTDTKGRQQPAKNPRRIEAGAKAAKTRREKKLWEEGAAERRARQAQEKAERDAVFSELVSALRQSPDLANLLERASALRLVNLQAFYGYDLLAALKAPEGNGALHEDAAAGARPHINDRQAP